jgi:hypothetical protein
VSWAAVIGGVVAAGGAIYQSNQAGKASKKVSAASQAALDEQRRQFDLVMQMLNPQRQLGNSAINTLNRLQGFDPVYSPEYQPNSLYSTAPTSAGGGGSSTIRTLTRDLPRELAGIGDIFGFDPFGSSSKKKKAKKAAEAAAAAQAAALQQQQQQYNTNRDAFIASERAKPQGLDVFTASPDYEFRRNEGLRGIENSFSARGGARSGNALRALADFNSNLASSEYGNFFNRLLAQAGLGQTATNNAVNSAQYTSGSIANLLGQQANARASGIVDQTNAITGGLNNLAGIYGAWLRNKQNSGYGTNNWVQDMM